MPFWGLSNFSPPSFTLDGEYWPTVEHYFQAQKFIGPEGRDRIRRALSPKDARLFGQSRKLSIRNDWDEIREEIMLTALRMKFQAVGARELLLSSGERMLIESSPFDYFGGAGQNGTGQNKLGYLLMKVRSELRKP
jgi:N-glycosidase YbiA